MGLFTSTSTGRGCISIGAPLRSVIRDARQPQHGAVHQPRVPREDDPAGGRLADHLAELQRAIAFGEILGVRQRVLVGDEHGRLLERALAEHRARRRGRHAARRHVQVGLPREHVERVRVDEAAVVVADVDDDAVARDVLGVEIDVELRERAGRHVGHVHVAEPAVAHLGDVVAPLGHPLAIEQPALGRGGDRAHGDVPARSASVPARRDPQHRAPVRSCSRAARRDSTCAPIALAVDGERGSRRRLTPAERRRAERRSRARSSAAPLSRTRARSKSRPSWPTPPAAAPPPAAR